LLKTPINIEKLTGCNSMPKVSVEIPQELLDDLNRHVGDNKKFVSQSDAIRTAIRKMLDMMDEIDRRHGRLNQ
jgi:Arc/MetJ-type ribon-helix-helix transcriptional regulator